MVKRKLDKDEKEQTKKGIRRLKEMIRIDNLSKEVIEKELELLPLKLEISSYVKNDELKKISERLSQNKKFLEKNEEALREGVEVKQND